MQLYDIPVFDVWSPGAGEVTHQLHVDMVSDDAGDGVLLRFEVCAGATPSFGQPPAFSPQDLFNLAGWLLYLALSEAQRDNVDVQSLPDILNGYGEGPEEQHTFAKQLLEMYQAITDYWRT